ncbi:MAG: hypothetical protein KOO60_06970 [Gemmatimonadales bacterium]|nr:hypothetical protein [Gemmatimonadales bacterium]
MFKRTTLVLIALLLPFVAVAAPPFDKNVISKVVTWDHYPDYRPTQDEEFICTSLSSDEIFVLGKIIKIEPIFPPRNRQPVGLVTMHVYEGDKAGNQTQFVTLNVFFTCEENTPYPRCRRDPANHGSLISIQTDNQPWVQPGDTVMLVLRPHKIQLEEIEGETRELAYARIFNGDYDKEVDQETYGQEIRNWKQTFDRLGYMRRENKNATPYEFLHLKRTKDPSVSRNTEF